MILDAPYRVILWKDIDSDEKNYTCPEFFKLIKTKIHRRTSRRRGNFNGP